MTEKTTTETVLDQVLQAIQSSQRRPFWSWLVGPVLTLIALITASVIYIGTTSEKEGAEEVEKAVAPIHVRLEAAEKRHTESMMTVQKTIEKGQERTQKQLESIAEDIDEVVKEQKSQGEKLHEIDKQQTELKVVVKTRLALPDG